jgi:molybdopterin synthase catalytic subunit
VSFSGTVRSSSTTGHEIVALEYETEASLAIPRIREVLDEARRRWPRVETLGVHHRIGRVELGDPTVLVVAASAHRTEAFEAARYCIDVVKRTVPMWKREIWEGGSAWSQEATPILSVHEL